MGRDFTVSDTNTDRRAVMKLVGGGLGATVLAGCLGDDEDPDDDDAAPADDDDDAAPADDDDDDDAPDELVDMHVLENEGAITAMVWLNGVANDAWEPHGIDLSVEVASFGKFSRQIVDDLSEPSGGISIPAIMNFRDEDEDISIYGVKLNAFVEMMQPVGGDIEGPTDLDDKTLAIPPAASTTTQFYRAIFENEFDYDLLEDPGEVIESDPVGAWSALREGDADAGILFSGFTISANASGDFETIFNPYDFWLEDHDYPPPMATFAAYRDWLEENPDLALRFLAGWEDAVEMALDDIDHVVTNFGLLAGVETEEEAEVVIDWMEEGRVLGEFDYSDEYADNNWELLQMLRGVGAWEGEYEQDEVLVSHDTLREWDS